MRLVDFVAKAQISAPTPPVRPLPPTPRLAEIGGFLPAQHFAAISFTREKKKKKKADQPSAILVPHLVAGYREVAE